MLIKKCNKVTVFIIMVQAILLSRYFTVFFTISNPVITQIYSIASIVSAGILIFTFLVTRKNYIFSNEAITWMIFVYIGVYTLITAINGGSIYHVLARSYPVLGTSCLISKYTKKHSEELIAAYAIISMILLTIQFFCIAFWDLSNYSLFAPKNQYGIFLAITFVFIAMYIYRIYDCKKQKRLILLTLCVISFCALKMSSASALISCICLGALLIPPISAIICKLSPTKIFVGYFVVWTSLVVFRINEWVGELLLSFFNKDVTLTGRTILWDIALESIKSNFLFGQGVKETTNVIVHTSKLITNEYVTTSYSAHNQMLQELYESGIVMPAMLFLCFVAVSAYHRGKKYYKEGKYLSITLIVVLINMLSETPGNYAVFLLLIFIFYLERFHQREKEVANG